MSDIESRSDVETLLRSFYGRVFTDDVLAAPFAELRTAGLESHLPVMSDFWETVLFQAGSYRGNAMRVHRSLDDRHRLDTAHFTRWLHLWNAAVDERYQGPTAERAKRHAARIATAMLRRLRGADAVDVDTPTGGRVHRLPSLRILSGDTASVHAGAQSAPL